MSKFSDALREEALNTTTTNGAFAKSSTGDAMLDLFSVLGTLRNQKTKTITNLVDYAYAQDPLLTVKALFYARDVREGLGERRVFYVGIKHLAETHPEAIKNNIYLFEEYGRFDDLYILKDTPLEKDVAKYIKFRIERDLTAIEEGKPVSLLGKWLDSPSSHSKTTKERGIWTAKACGYDIYTYKRIVSELRKGINTVEALMSNNQWDEIDYSKLPSQAMNKHYQAFVKHSPERIEQYKEDLKSGKTSINSTTLYPRDIVKNLYDKKADETICSNQWSSLPNYCNGEFNAIVMADVSGSMTLGNEPIFSSIGLAIYFAERNKGAYHNLFMTFSRVPNFVELKDEMSLSEKINKVYKSEWGMNTNLDLAFDRILEIAVENHIPQEEMPKALIIISDMQFDEATNQGRTLYYKLQKDKFANAGYELPNIVFWNASDFCSTFHAPKLAKGVQLFSGQSASVFKNVMQCLDVTPIEAMTRTLNAPRYERITIETNSSIELD